MGAARPAPVEPGPESLFISIIIPTIGREVLKRAVRSILDQETRAGFELIVVNDSGEVLSEAEWAADPRVRVLATDRRERGYARNTGAEAARGTYLLFLDDDDWLEPQALDFLFTAAADTRAKLIYGATRLVDREGRPIIDLTHGLVGNLACQTMCGEWIPLQSLAIEALLFREIGTFHIWQSGSEDIDLVRRAAVRADFHYIPHLISNVGMGAAGSTTDGSRQLVLGRRGREMILDQPDTFRRMRRGARAPRWSGGIVRIYLTSAAWNLARFRLFRGARRLLYAAAALVRSGRHMLDSAFWSAVVRPYQSVTFARGFAEAGR